MHQPFTRITGLFSTFFLLLSLSAMAKKAILFPFFPTDSITSPVNFNTVRVIDIRSNKSNLGVFMGRSPVSTADSLHLELERMLRRMVRPAAQKEQHELLAVVQNVVLTDIVKGLPAMISTVYLRIDWYLGQDGHYSLLKETDSLSEFPVRGNTNGNICLVTNFLITEWAKEVAAMPAPSAYPLDLAAILSEEERARNSAPVYSDAPKEGIYYTSAQFRNNSPGTGDFVHKHYTGDFIIDEFLLADPGSRKSKSRNLADSAYAIYDGKKWYRPYMQTNFKEMKKEGSDFYYLAIQKGISLENYSMVAGAGYSQGILGALISAGVAAVLEERQNHKPVPMADALYRMRIDPVSGEGKRVERIR